jgi:putative ABC transport system ATP-binding protein
MDEMSPGPPALSLRDVRKVYPGGGGEVVALADASLTVAAGEIVALIGPSGSGKTTLLSVAGGLLSPTSGTVVIGEHDISEVAPRKLASFRSGHIGFVFQSVNLVPFLTARENLMVVAELAGVRRAPARERADRLLGELGLGHRRNALATSLSGGERQRVAVGRALMNDPPLVLFDEPTSALDTKLGEEVMELIRSELKQRGTAGVIVTHDERMTRFADRTVRIADGVLHG